MDKNGHRLIPSWVTPRWAPLSWALLLTLWVALPQISLASEEELNPNVLSHQPSPQSSIDSGSSFLTAISSTLPSLPPGVEPPDPKQAYLPKYFRALRKISKATQISSSEIDLDLTRWSKTLQPRTTPEVLTQFLTHYYFVLDASPNTNWKIEFNHLQVAASARYLFDQLGVFLRKDPLTILQEPSGRWSIGDKTEVTWKGSFKTIYRVTSLNEPSNVAFAFARVMPPSSDPPRNTREAILIRDAKELYDSALDELKIIRAIRKASNERMVEGILCFVLADLDLDSNRILFLSPFHNRGNASDYASTEIILPDDQTKIAKELISGLRFLHTNQIVHRDIKPQNILLHQGKSGLHAVLADFGTAYQDGQPGLTEKLKNESFLRTTHRYLAPEAIEKFMLWNHRKGTQIADEWAKAKAKFKRPPSLPLRWNPEWSEFETDRASDLWSLGVALLEINSEFKLSSRNWIRLMNPKFEEVLDFIQVDQQKVDQVLLELYKSWKEDKRLDSVFPALWCLLRVNPQERCSAQEAFERIPEDLPPAETIDSAS